MIFSKNPHRLLAFLVGATICIIGCKSVNYTTDKGSKISKPNVVLVITDDQGYGDVGAHGHPILKTPHLDRLHQESVRLTDFHVSPTCAPTRASLLTGRYKNRTGVWHTVGGWSLLRANEKTMADMFREAGYATGAFGKWHLGDNYPYRAMDRGFAETVVHGGGGVQQTPDFWNNDYYDDTYFHNGQPQAYTGYCTDVFFDEAIRFIENNREQPFFCYLATNAPHWPYNVPPGYEDQYRTPELLPTQQRFFQMITNIDDNVGRLRETLMDLKVADNTIFVFMTDNGTAAGWRQRDDQWYGYNAGMRSTKGSAYDGGHRVPCFFYWKNGQLTGGRDVRELTAHIDVMPTLANLCGIDLPNEHLPLDGINLSPLLKNNAPNWSQRTLITDSQRIQRPEKWRNSATMTRRWRLVNGDELYDMSTDPGQMNDVAASFPDTVARLRRDYEEWWAATSKDFGQEPPIYIGTDAENPVVLTSHDCHAPNGQQNWNQLGIRKLEPAGGYWTLDIRRVGNYRVALRRYPRESGLGINATAPGYGRERVPGLEAFVPAGQAAGFTSATLELGPVLVGRKPVLAGAEEVVFDLTLRAGLQRMTATFQGDHGEETGAYYVYVERLDGRR